MKRPGLVSYRMSVYGVAFCGGVVAAAVVGCGEPAVTAQPAGATEMESQTDESQYETVSLRGRVVWTNDALTRRYGIRTVPEAKERSLALEGVDGRIYPIIEDPQGRAFRTDERLRERDVELYARFHPAVGMIQVIRIYFIQPDGKYLVDYWCDVCAISMIEDGPCDCCQAPNRLREQLAQ